MARNKVRIEIDRVEPYVSGMSFGDTGTYERLIGTAYYEIDPNEEGLPDIVDLDLAPRNADGMVEFSGVLDIVKPIDMSKGNKRILYEFSNRGGRSLAGLNYGGGADNTKPAYAGDGFLQKEGYTLMWSGWQGDLFFDRGLVTADLPYALEDGKPLRGKIRQEYSAVTPGILYMGTSEGAENGHNVQNYPVLDKATATMTIREHEADERVPVPDSDWELATAETVDGKLVVTPSNEHVYMHGGFKTGFIYEMIYETEGSRVMGLGFLGIRDLMSMIRFDETDSYGNPNPLAGNVEKIYGTGGSMSGRVVREYVYGGWNQDTENRRLFDAMHTHTGSGRLIYNTRFAQVGRYPRQHEEHSWPSETYPFTFIQVPDPFTERVDGLWKRPNTDPLVLHTHTDGDYWIRHVSLTHTDPRDGTDVELPEDKVRMYHFTCAPHMSRPLNDPMWIGQITPNDMSSTPYRRAVIKLMDEWATNGTPPPASMVPRTADGTLVTSTEALSHYPNIGINKPKDTSKLPRWNYGSDFESKGIQTVFPPTPHQGQEYPLRVPQIDSDGNSIAGLRYPDADVPLGTYNGWSLRKPGWAEGDQFWNTGSFVPFARTRAEREAKNDPRPSIEERYPTHEAYVDAVKRCCDRLVGQRLLLQVDADRMIETAQKNNPLDPSTVLGPLMRVNSAPAGSR